MKRVSVVLIVGKDVYVVSCSGVVISSVEVVDQLRYGVAKIVGKAALIDGKSSGYHLVNGDVAPFPNRIKHRFNIIDVDVRRSFAKLVDVMPVQLKELAVDSETFEYKGVVYPLFYTERGAKYIKCSVDCSNCGDEISGTRLVSQDRVQVFHPNSDNVVNQRKDWYCGCTSVKKFKQPVVDERAVKHVVETKAQTEVKFVGSIAEILVSMREFLKSFEGGDK